MLIAERSNGKIIVVVIVGSENDLSERIVDACVLTRRAASSRFAVVDVSGFLALASVSLSAKLGGDSDSDLPAAHLVVHASACQIENFRCFIIVCV